MIPGAVPACSSTRLTHATITNQTSSHFAEALIGWGWIHLILGLVVAFAGWGLLSGRTWARVVAITVAVFSAIANFLWLPY